MRATCPNSPEHKEFVTCATVCEDWIVDEEGNWTTTPKYSDTVTVHGPNIDNVWTCTECGQEAVVE